ncbi:MAG: hypothetical protein Q8L98_00030 [Chlamydiales bacterium]|nr:hypothetical protein [Chlamydiales bacterium]
MSNDELKNNKFDWGETVQVKNNAPSIFQPGQIVSVCGMTKIQSKKLADKYDLKIGEWIYTIEYLGGADIEIPECYLEKFSELF